MADLRTNFESLPKQVEVDLLNAQNETSVIFSFPSASSSGWGPSCSAAVRYNRVIARENKDRKPVAEHPAGCGREGIEDKGSVDAVKF